MSFAGVQLYVSNYMGPELTDIVPPLLAMGALAGVMQFWQPRNIYREPDAPKAPPRVLHDLTSPSTKVEII